MMSSFGERLEILLDEDAENQTQVASAIGVSHSTITQWKRREGFPEVSNLIALSNRWKVSVDYILGRSDLRRWPEPTRPQLPALFDPLIEPFLSLPEDAQVAVAGIVQCLVRMNREHGASGATGGSPNNEPCKGDSSDSENTETLDRPDQGQRQAKQA